MSSTSPLYPGLAISENSAGSYAWSSPENVYAVDGSYASCMLSALGESEYLWCTDFDFASQSIPGGATIVGITVAVRRRCSVGSCDTLEARLIKYGLIAGDDKSFGDAWGASAETVGYGDAADDWNASLIVLDVEDVDFGFALRVVDTDGSSIAEVDWITMTIDYEVASPVDPVAYVVRSASSRARSIEARGLSRVFAPDAFTDHVTVVVEHWPQTIYARAARNVSQRPQSRVFAPTEQAAPIAIVSMYDPAVVVVAGRQRSPGRIGRSQIYSAWPTSESGVCDCPPAGAVLVGGGGFAAELVDAETLRPFRATIESTGNYLAKPANECDC